MDKKKIKITNDYELKLSNCKANRKNTLHFPSSKMHYDNEEFMFSEFDPFGSYTGISENYFDKPIQDADDL